MEAVSFSKHSTFEKLVGETPLACLERYRAGHPKLFGVPLAYAGRLDPMASGKLLILIGDECKRQTKYHELEKEYEFSVLFGITSDSLDVLGRLQQDVSGESPAALTFFKGINHSRTTARTQQNQLTESLNLTCANLIGPIELPYPHYSAKTVSGKPLHTWALEGRLDEIDIPTKRSTIYEISCLGLETKPRAAVANEARAKIDTIPPVTDDRKALGADFRRTDVRADWERIKHDDALPEQYSIAHFRCTASSGTYMRSLAQVIAKELGTIGLAWRIHRTRIGTYDEKEEIWKQTY